MSLDEILAAAKKTPSGSGPARPSGEQPPRPIAWFQVWFRALTSPTLETYEAILRDSKVSAGRALVWIIAGSIIATAVDTVVTEAQWISAVSAQDEALPPGSILAGGLFILILAPIVILILRFIVFSVATGIGHVVALLFGGGTAPITRWIYLNAAYYAPLTIIESIVIDLLNWLAPVGPAACLVRILIVAFALYRFQLVVTSLRAAHQLSPSSALATGILVDFLLSAPLVAMMILFAYLSELR